jgi:hypothetical protein
LIVVLFSGKQFMHIQEENMLNNKSVKISQGQLESVNRRTENTMAKENRKKDNNDLQNITHQTKDRVNINTTKTNDVQKGK